MMTSMVLAAVEVWDFFVDAAQMCLFTLRVRASYVRV